MVFETVDAFKYAIKKSATTEEAVIADGRGLWFRVLMFSTR
jgi:hypothetical protein